MKTFFAKLYRDLVNYLNDSSELDTGAHRGAPHYIGLYSGLWTSDQNDHQH